MLTYFVQEYSLHFNESHVCLTMPLLKRNRHFVRIPFEENIADEVEKQRLDTVLERAFVAEDVLHEELVFVLD